VLASALEEPDSTPTLLKQTHFPNARISAIVEGGGHMPNIRPYILPVLAVALMIACATALTWIAFSSVVDKEAKAWALPLLGTVGFGAAISFAVYGKSPGFSWLSAKGLALLFGAVMAGFGAMSALGPNFFPRTAVESDPGAIERGVEDIGDILRESASPDPVLTRLSGRWGTANCDGPTVFVTLTAAPNAEIVFTSTDWSRRAEIRGIDGDTIFVRQTEPAVDANEYALVLRGSSLLIDTNNTAEDRTIYRCD